MRKSRKWPNDLMDKMDKLTKKHGIKVVGSWASMPDHTSVAVYNAPTMEAMLKFSMEPEVITWMGYNTTEMKPVMTLKDAMKLLK